jgi:hypothetical protein
MVRAELPALIDQIILIQYASSPNTSILLVGGALKARRLPGA